MVSGWAEAHLGSPQDGLRLILEGFEHNRRAGMLAGASEMLGYAVEALLLVSDWDAAQAHLDQARELGQRFGERILFMYHHMLQSPSLARQRCWRSAQPRLAVDEIRLLVHICSLPNATRADLASLKAAYDRLTEGFSTAMVSRARELLEQAARKSS